MEDDSKKNPLPKGEVEEKKPLNRETKTEPVTETEPPANTGGGGWGGWGFSPLSVFTDLQKAAQEISRNVSFDSPHTLKSELVSLRLPYLLKQFELGR